MDDVETLLGAVSYDSRWSSQCTHPLSILAEVTIFPNDCASEPPRTRVCCFVVTHVSAVPRDLKSPALANRKWTPPAPVGYKVAPPLTSGAFVRVVAAEQREQIRETSTFSQSFSLELQA